jgi:tetratricopeptide (TPR) repeat protein
MAEEAAEDTSVADQPHVGTADQSAPVSFETLATPAYEAERKRGWDIAVEKWRLVFNHFPQHWRAAMGLANALRMQKQFDAADTVLLAGLAFNPGHQALLELYARVSSGREDWDEAARRWHDLVQRYPQSAEAWMGHINARLKRGDLTGAQTAAAEAVDRFPDNADLLVVQARAASHAKDWTLAEHCWDIARNANRDNATYWFEHARALQNLNRKSEANLLLAWATSLFPDHRSIVKLHATLSAEIGNWAQAALLWKSLHEAEPSDRKVQKLAFEAAWRAIGMRVGSLSVVNISPKAIGGTAPRDLMLRFQSFGVDTEFALIQRYFGADPVSLLRWAEIPTIKLAAALDSNFDGVGEPDTIELKLASDFKVRDRRYGFASHTWVKENQTDYETFLAQQCQRLQYLRRNLLEDIKDGDKILVYKNAEPESVDQLMRLHRAIRKLGPATLLYVRKSDSQHKHTTVEALTDGLLVGYLDELVGAGNLNLDHPGWMMILRKALILAGLADEEIASSLAKEALVQRFEGLGNNCEFGYVQRIAGAEPLGLLRWSTTKLPVLADAFENNLTGIGDVKHTELYTNLDYRVVDPRYDLTMQTFISEEPLDGAGLLAEQSRRTRKLREALLVDLRSGEKIFVHKTAVAPPMEEIFTLHRAMRRHGPAILLHVRLANAEFPHLTLQQPKPGLLIGYMDRLVVVGGGWEADHESWLALCRLALDEAESG